MEALPHFSTNVELAPYTTYKIGGLADYFIEATTEDDLITAVSVARASNIPWFLIGTGANILIGDHGFRGLVILNRYASIDRVGATTEIGSGAVIADLIEWSIASGLSGLEHFAGIPSTLGGALKQNLHFLTPDRTSTLYLGELVESARVIDETGNIKTLAHEELQFAYDDSVFHHRPLVALTANLRLISADAAIMIAQVASNMAWRTERQPQLPAQPSCGSVFKKIDGIGAGRLIDSAGLKGLSIGGAQVSPLHANYLVNTGGATAADVCNLIRHIQSTVLATSGYHLEPEISFIGEF